MKKDTQNDTAKTVGAFVAGAAVAAVTVGLTSKDHRDKAKKLIDKVSDTIGEIKSTVTEQLKDMSAEATTKTAALKKEVKNKAEELKKKSMN